MLGEASVISSSTAEPEPPLGEAVELKLKLFAMDGGVVFSEGWSRLVEYHFLGSLRMSIFPPPEIEEPSPPVEQGVGESIFGSFIAPVDPKSQISRI